MTILHIACLPFPTYQGTQAALHQMLRVSSELGRQVHLLTYAHGAYELDAPYPVHRIPDFPRVRSLRSGPSPGKLALDAHCIQETIRLWERLKPDAIVAHHVEAALAALTANVGPVFYVAHTSLEHELPVYFPRLFKSPLAAVARRVEAKVCQHAAGVAAVAPSISMFLGRRSTYLPVPWRRSEDLAPTQSEARTMLGLPLGVPVCLYAGNLDRYQGWEDLIEALGALRDVHPNARLLIATESDPAPARGRAANAGLGDALHVTRLDGESARRRVHAASDCAWIPRRTAGGLPIKMLDAFARGLPVIATKRATAALPVDAVCIRVPDETPQAFAEAASRLTEPALADRLRSAAFTYLDRHHSANAFDVAFQRLLKMPQRPTVSHRRSALNPAVNI